MLSQVYKAERELFPRLYKTLLVFTDGSTINVRYHEPRAILKMPEDCSNTTRRLKVFEQFELEKDDVKFDARKYISRRRKQTT